MAVDYWDTDQTFDFEERQTGIRGTRPGALSQKAQGIRLIPRDVVKKLTTAA